MGRRFVLFGKAASHVTQRPMSSGLQIRCEGILTRIAGGYGLKRCLNSQSNGDAPRRADCWTGTWRRVWFYIALCTYKEVIRRNWEDFTAA